MHDKQLATLGIEILLPKYCFRFEQMHRADYDSFSKPVLIERRKHETASINHTNKSNPS
jgi:hypothetical protein